MPTVTNSKDPDLYHHQHLKGRLFGSENPFSLGDASLIQELVNLWGISDILVLTQWAPPPCDVAVHWHHVPIQGTPGMATIERTNAILTDCLGREGRAWVYCERGIDRTGCVIGCFLVSRGQDPHSVIDLLVSHAAGRLNHKDLKYVLGPSYAPILDYAGRDRPGRPG